MTTFPFYNAGGFHGNSPFCLGEDEEVEIEIQEDFLSFSADLVAEQLTYMDAVRDHILIYNIPTIHFTTLQYTTVLLIGYFKIGYKMYIIIVLIL